jgi:hypothetical protein
MKGGEAAGDERPEVLAAAEAAHTFFERYSPTQMRAFSIS